MTSKKIFFLWNILILVLCIALGFVLWEKILSVFGRQNTAAVDTEIIGIRESVQSSNTVEKSAAEKTGSEKNTVKQKRPPRKPKEVNFNDSNASSFTIDGLEDTGTMPNEIRFAGTAGTGKKIVFVLDSSEIMGSGAATPWSFACNELAFSFKDLNDTQNFQVFFFSDEPNYLQSSQGEPQWISATPQNKKESFDFLKKHISSGKGSVFASLKEALTLRPDAVFFLTTQKSIPLTEAEIEAIKTLEETLPKLTPIHIAELGEGMENSSKSAFQKLADMTKGQYRWININLRGLKW